METNLIAKQTLQIYHAALMQTLDAALAAQDQSQKTLETLLEQSSAVPQEGKRAINDWLEACRHQTEAVKSVIDEGFNPFTLSCEE
jgi:tellurite resistance protein